MIINILEFDKSKESYQQGDFRSIAYLFNLPQKLELYLFECFSNNRKGLAHDLLVTLADLTVKLLTSDQLLVFCKLIFHLLILQQVDVLLEKHRHLGKDLGDSWTFFREEGERAYV